MAAIGIDISKQKIDVWLNGKLTTLQNNTKAIEKHFKSIDSQDTKIVMEATGRYHRITQQVLATLDLPVMVINPYQSRHFAKSMNVICKTDKVDARVLSEYALRMDFKPTKARSEHESELQDLIRHVDDLKSILKQYKQRLEGAYGASKKSLLRLIKNLELEIAEIETTIKQHINADKDMARRKDLLKSIPGIGDWCAAVLIGLLGELGHLSNREIIAMAGLAPINFDSGKFTGKRHIQKGRHDVRRLLYMPTLGAATQHNKALKCMYDRLINAGKPPKVALTACMRKMLIFANATLKNNTAWELKEAGLA
jgi:transposase